MPTITVPGNNSSWTDTGLVLLPGEGLRMAATGSIVFGAGNGGWVAYPEGAYASGVGNPPEAGFPATSVYDPSSVFTQDVTGTDTRTVASQPPYCLVLCVRPDGAGAPPVDGSATGALRPGRSGILPAKHLPASGGRVWAIFNDERSYFADNTGAYQLSVARTRPTDVEIRFYDRLTGERLPFNPDALTGDTSVELTSLGGVDNITCQIAARFEEQRPPLGSLMDVIVLSDPIQPGQYEPFPRFRGILAQPEASLDTAETKTLLAYGLMEDMSRVPLSGTISDGPKSDLSQLAAKVLQSYLEARPWLTSRHESVIEETGVLRDTVEVEDSDCRAALDAIAAESPSLAVWGWRVSETSGDFQFVFRPRSEAVGNEFTVGDTVRRYTRPEELAKVENSVLITGAETDKPNIIGVITGNAAFNRAENRGALGANLLSDGNFDKRQNATLSGGASYKAGKNGIGNTLSEGPTYSGSSMVELDNPGEKVSKHKDDIAASLPDVGKPISISVRYRLEVGTDTRVGVADFYWRSGGSRMPGGPHASIALTPGSAGYWPEARLSAVRPPGADGVEVEVTAGGGSGGLLIGNLSIYNPGRLVPVGWDLKPYGDAVFTAIDPLYPDFWPGNPLVRTALRVAVQADDEDDQDAHLETIAQATGKCSGNQTLRLVFRAKRTPGSVATTGKMFLLFRSFRGNGEETSFLKVFIPAGTFGDEWVEYETDFTVDDDAENVTVFLAFRGDTDLLISCMQLRDDSAGSEFIRGSNWERVVNAEDVCEAGSAAALSASVYDRRFGRVTNSSLKEWSTEAQAWAKDYLTLKAVPPSRARLAISHEAVQRLDPLDGKQIRLNGLSVAVRDDWAERVTYKFAGLLSMDAELGGDAPSLQRMLAGGRDRQNGAVSAGGGGSATVSSSTGSGALNDNISLASTNAAAALTAAESAVATVSAVSDEVIAARNSAALGAFDTLDERLEAMEAAAEGVTVPAGTDKQTLRYDGTTLVADSFLKNSGSAIGIGVSPSGSFPLEIEKTTGSDLIRLANDGGGGISLERRAIPTAANQRLGGIGLFSALGGGAVIEGRSEEAWGAGRSAGIRFFATSVGSSTLGDRMYLSGRGDLSFTPDTGAFGLRLANVARGTVTAPLAGAIIFDGGVRYWDGAAWVLLASSSGGTGDMAKSDYDADNDGKIDLAAGGTGASTAAGARSALGLGTAATLNAPAAGNAASGEVVLGSDTRLGVGGAGSGWSVIYPNVVPPVAADFTWINQGPASVATNAQQIYLLAPPASGENVRIQLSNAALPPAGTWTVTAMFLPMHYPATFALAGIVLRESSTGKLVGWDVYQNGASSQAEVRQMPSPTGFGGQPFAIQLGSYAPYWYRIQDNGTSRIYSFSMDGLNFVEFFREARTNYMTPNQAGFYCQPLNASTPASVTCVSWQVTMP